MSFSVSFVCDKTPLADPGAIAAYQRVLCSTLLYKCAESSPSMWLQNYCIFHFSCNNIGALLYFVLGNTKKEKFHLLARGLKYQCFIVYNIWV